MKLLTSLSIVAAALAFSLPVRAQVLSTSMSATQSVSVAATLASACMFDSSTAVALSANYPAFSADAVTTNEGDVNITCTRGKTPVSLTFAGTAVGTASGLVFQLSLGSWIQSQAGDPPAGVNIADVGSPLKGKFVVKATFPAGQAGSNGDTTAPSKALTITF